MAVSVPSLNWLRVFEAAARAESFARAADELNMSAAAVSQQVRALEERLGAPLFERHAHAVRLTEAGRAYLPGVQQSLSTLQSTTEGLFGAQRSEVIYLRAVLLFAHGVLAEGHGDFLANHPQITLQIDTGNSHTDFFRGFSDLQVVFGNPSAFGAQGDPLLSERLFPVARPEVAEQIHSPEDLVNYRLIEIGTHRAGWPHVFDVWSIWPGSVSYVFADSTIMAFALARSGAGVALARAPVSDRAMAEAGLVPCLEGVSVEGQEAYHLVYPDRAALRPAARACRDWLLAYCAERS